MSGKRSFEQMLEQLDRKIIYAFITISLGVPLWFGLTLPPAEMKPGTQYFDVLEKIENKPDHLVLIAMDWGPGTQAENLPQTVVTIEHLMRRRIPFALISLYNLAGPLLDSVPRDVKKMLEHELPGQQWSYGKDWVNLGFRPGSILMIQSLAKADNWQEHLKTDASGTPLKDVPCFKEVRSIRNISLFIEITGLKDVLSNWIQFFQAGSYRPPFLHACTSISVPDAHDYLSAKQIIGLHEGVAGAAWHDSLLSKRYPEKTPGPALKTNTSLAFAHLIIIFFIIVGNVGYFLHSRAAA